MKALSLWEPWASLMAVGAKRIETRSWPTRYRGPLLICAAKRPMDGPSREIADMAALQGFLITPAYGMAVCTVELTRCDRIVPFNRTVLEHFLGDYTPGRFAWITENVQRFQFPFSVVGHQGLFDVSDSIVDRKLTECEADQ